MSGPLNALPGEQDLALLLGSEPVQIVREIRVEGAPAAALTRVTGGVEIPQPGELPPAYKAAYDTPAHFLTPYLGHIDRMAAQGMEPKYIAARIAISLKTLKDAAERFADVSLALTGGLARGIDLVSHAMLDGAVVRGESGPQSLFLKARAGFVTERTGGPSVVVNVGGQPAPETVTIEAISDMADRQARLGLEAPDTEPTE